MMYSFLLLLLFQALFFVSVRPFSKKFYRRINRVLAELLWLELVWLVDWWAGLKVSFFPIFKFEFYLLFNTCHALQVQWCWLNHSSSRFMYTLTRKRFGKLVRFVLPTVLLLWYPCKFKVMTSMIDEIFR